MKVRKYYWMRQLANMLKKIAVGMMNCFIFGAELLLIDAVFGKPRFRKCYPRVRPIIHKTYIVHTPRVMMVKG